MKTNPTSRVTRARVDLFENANSLFSCGQVKMELSKTLTSQRRFITHQSIRSDLGRSREGILFICFRISNITSFFRVEGNSFENAPRVDADIFLIRMKTWMNFQKYPDKAR